MTADAAAELAAATRSRAVAAGIDVYEYDQVAGALQDLTEWPAAFRETAERHRSAARDARDDGRAITAADNYRLASLWFYFAGAFPSPDFASYRDAADTQQAALDLQGARSARVVGQEFVGVLRLPSGSGDTTPLVVILGGVDGAKEESLAVSDELIRRGLATLALDGPGQGELAGSRPPTQDFAAVVSAALDAACTGAVPGWSPAAVGALGTSLGGHYTLRSLAAEPRIRAAVVVSGFATASWAAVHPYVQSLMTFRAGSEQVAREFADSLDITARIPAITQSLLLVDGGQDALVQGDFTGRWIASTAPNAEYRLVPTGDHNVANARWEWLPQAADWLAARLVTPALPESDAAAAAR
ncbi:alpha/beta hydrolase [Dactylosporangium sp. CA-233914]|uniref:alpha/beta hydrolase n=1 Tax=Dactylosporangium sp. CA-233914 TaxID=3239934 RepID=UPI003D9298B5